MSFVTTRYLLVFVLLASSLLLENTDARIIGGNDVEFDKYPFFVMINVDDGRTQAPTVSLSPTETSSPTWAPSDGFGTSPPTFTPFTYSPSSTPSPTPSFTLPPAATYVPIDDDGTPPPTEIKFGRCGGALIAPDIILTAAHCSPPADESGVVNATDPALSISAYYYVGEFQERTCVEWINDPDYTDYISGPDFALCKLDKPFDVDESLVSLELNDKPSVPVDDAMLTVIGLGALDTFFSLPDVLQEVDVPAMSNEECRDKPYLEAFRDSINDNSICAGYFDGEDGTEDIPNGLSPDACQGDSGGPLMERTELEDGKVVYSLVGVVSWGFMCGVKGLPGVYARVSTRFDWISATACSISESNPSFCKPPIQSKKGKASKKKGKKGKHDKKGKKSKKSPKSFSSSSEDSPDDNDQTSPPTNPVDSIADIIATYPFLSTFATAFEAAGMEELLDDEFAAYFVIAPTNDAFDNLPSNALPCLLKPENKDVLRDILFYHILDVYSNPALFSYPFIDDGELLITLQGENIIYSVDETGGPPFYGVNNGKLLIYDVNCFFTFGYVVSTVDTVLYPPSLDINAFLDDFCD